VQAGVAMNIVTIAPFYDGMTRCCVNRVQFKVKARDNITNEIIATKYVCTMHLRRDLVELFDLPKWAENEVRHG